MEIQASPDRRNAASRAMKHLRWSTACAIVIIGASVGHAQRGPAVPQMRGDGPAPEAKPFSITRTDPALDDIISPNAQLVELARGFGLSEGGLWIAEGNSGYWIFTGLLDNGYVFPQTTLGAISPSTGRTLPDRYIEGTCPICGYDGARGDQCDNCGNQLDAIELGSPRLSLIHI